MDFETISNLIMNNGIAVVCVAYMIYFQNTTMKDIQSTLMAMTERLTTIETKIDERKKGGDELC